jgi:hypothetical protein
MGSSRSQHRQIELSSLETFEADTGWSGECWFVFRPVGRFKPANVLIEERTVGATEEYSFFVRS